MAKIGDTIKTRYAETIARSMWLQQLVRVALILFLLGFVWVGWSAGSEGVLNLYFRLSSSTSTANASIKDVNYVKSLANGDAIYTVNGSTYSVRCFQPTIVWAFGDPGMRSISVRYITNSPYIAACEASIAMSLWLAFIGIGGLTIATVGLFILLFRAGSPIYQQLLGTKLSVKHKTKYNKLP